MRPKVAVITESFSYSTCQTRGKSFSTPRGQSICPPPIAKHSCVKKVQAIGLNHFSWQGLLSLNGTFEEWVKKSDVEIAAIEAEIPEIRALLDD
jgi:hypothetical protein